jgi:methyl-accepting chemotaxis protein
VTARSQHDAGPGAERRRQLTILGNVSLRWQVMLVPALLIAAIVVIATMNVREQTRSNAAASRLFGESIARAASLAGTAELALDLNGRMFRATTLAQSGAPAAILRSVAGTLPADLDTLGQRLTEVEETARRDGHLAQAAHLHELSAKYRKAGADFAKFLFVDQSMAADFATAAGAFFQDLHTDLKSLSATYDAAAKAEFAALRKSSADALRLTVLAGLLAVAGGIALSLWLSHTIAAPLVELTGVVGVLARSDWTVHVPYATRGDEVGAVARAVNVFRDNGLENERLMRVADERQRDNEAHRRAEAARERAEQDRLAQEAERAQHFAVLAARFDSVAHEVLENFANAFSALQATAGAMGSAADATKDRAENVSAAAVEASGNVRTIAAAIEQLGAAIDQIARQVASSSELATIATAEADRLQVTLEDMNAAAREISSVLDFIKSVASRTKLLALNATIEAARAGAAGRGFAVVAAEVKALAIQTTEATEGINRKVERLQSLSVGAASAVGDIGGRIRELSSGSMMIAAAVTGQNEAMREMAATVQSAAEFTDRVSNQIRDVKVTADETEQAAGSVLQASEDLAFQTDRLESEVSGFLETVRVKSAA